MNTEPFKPGVRPFTHYANANEKRLFLVVDIPFKPDDNVVLMEVKDYAPEEERTIVRLPYSDWVTMTEDKKLLKPYTPKL